MNLADPQNTHLSTLNVERSMLDVERSAAARPLSLFTAQCHLIDDITERAAPARHLLDDMFAKGIRS